MHVRRFAAGLLACVTFAACSDNSTTAPTAPSNNDTPALARAHTGPLVTQLTNLAGGAANNVNPLVRGLAGHVHWSGYHDQLCVQCRGPAARQWDDHWNRYVCYYSGSDHHQTVNQAFTNLLVTPAAANCRILHLDLGPIFLDLLGLQLTTSEIVVDLRRCRAPATCWATCSARWPTCWTRTRSSPRFRTCSIRSTGFLPRSN